MWGSDEAVRGLALFADDGRGVHCVVSAIARPHGGHVVKSVSSPQAYQAASESVLVRNERIRALGVFPKATFRVRINNDPHAQPEKRPCKTRRQQCNSYSPISCADSISRTTSARVSARRQIRTLTRSRSSLSRVSVTATSTPAGTDASAGSVSVGAVTATSPASSSAGAKSLARRAGSAINGLAGGSARACARSRSVGPLPSGRSTNA